MPKQLTGFHCHHRADLSSITQEHYHYSYELSEYPELDDRGGKLTHDELQAAATALSLDLDTALSTLQACMKKAAETKEGL